jgi:single-strand DNA-binding protein
MSSRSLNKVMLIGNLTRDPELRYTPQGSAVCSFGLATNRSWMPSEGGERREETEFHRIVAWNKLAELCSQLLTKGRKVYVEGRLQTRSWESPEGEKRQSTEIVAEDMVLLDSRRPEGSNGIDEDRAENVNQDVEEVKGKSAKVEKSKEEPKGEEPKKEEKPEEKKESDEINVDDIPF